MMTIIIIIIINSIDHHSGEPATGPANAIECANNQKCAFFGRGVTHHSNIDDYDGADDNDDYEYDDYHDGADDDNDHLFKNTGHPMLLRDLKLQSSVHLPGPL